MRRWWTDARVAAVTVADHGSLWLPGALAWALTIGWLPLLAVVARPPSVTDLTFLGARIYTDGSWPWNAVAAVGGVLLLAAVGLLLVSLSEAALVSSTPRRVPSRGAVGRLLAIGLVTSTPAAVALTGTGVAAVMVALGEFNAPGVGDPLLRTVTRVVPLLAVVGVAWLLGGMVHAAAARAALLGGAGVADALAAGSRRLRAVAAASVLHAVVLLGLRLGYLAFAAVLLGVLWAPIGPRLAGGLLDAGTLPLLVGFVAIWLCLVLGGGALHAWGSLTWTRVLAAPASKAHRDERLVDGDPQRP